MRMIKLAFQRETAAPVMAVMFATGALFVRAGASFQWAATAVVAIFFLLFAFQVGTFFYRNRPGRYRPDAIPSSVLPRT